MNELHRRWRELRRRGGDFARTPDDARASSLTRTWDAVWGPCPPAGPDLRGAHPRRWLRFWSFPDGKRRADDDAEQTALVERHRRMLTSLHPAGSPLIVAAADWGPRDGAGGWTRHHLAGRRPWRVSTDVEEGTTTYFWVAESAPAALDDLLELAAQDVAHLVVMPNDMSWLYAPYEGGSDVFVVDDAARLALRDHFADWLSPRADGL